MPELYNSKELMFPETIQIEDGSKWKVQQPFVYTFINNENRFVNILIPAGWETDYGSIPKVFQNIIEPIGHYSPCYVVHDFMYASEYYSTHSECDGVLLNHLEERGASWIRRNIVYSAVRSFGGLVWTKHEEDKVNALRSLANQTKFEMSVYGNKWGIHYDPMNDIYTADWEVSDLINNSK